MNKIAKNYIFSILYQMLNIILPLITTPYVSRTLGVSGVGYNSYVSSIVNYYSLFLILGTYTYGQREIGANQNNKEKYEEIFWNIFILKLGLGFIVFTVYLTTIPFYADKLLTLFLVRAITLVANTLDTSWFFQGMENFRVTVTRQMIIRVVGAACIFIFIKKPEDLIFYALIDAALALLGNISILPYLKKYLRDVNIFRIVQKKKVAFSLKIHLKGTIAMFVPQVATSLYMSLDKSMIGYFYMDGIQSGFYEQATKIHMLGLTVVIALTGVLIPRLALYHNEGNTEALRTCSNKAITYIFFIGAPVAFGISSISFNFLPWFLGEDFIGACYVLQISSFLIIVMGLTNFLGYGFLVATRQHKIYTKSVVIGTIVNICFNSLLIPILGAIGAAVASVMSECVVLVFQCIAVRRILIIRFIIRNTYQYLLLSAIMGVITLMLSKSLDPNALNTIIIACVGVVLYGVPLLVLKDAHIMQMLHLLKSRRIQ